MFAGMVQLASKALCAQWSSEGRMLAIGCEDGSVSIRDRTGAETHKIGTGPSAVWSLAWSPLVRLAPSGGRIKHGGEG